MRIMMGEKESGGENREEEKYAMKMSKCQWSPKLRRLNKQWLLGANEKLNTNIIFHGMFHGVFIDLL